MRTVTGSNNINLAEILIEANKWRHEALHNRGSELHLIQGLYSSQWKSLGCLITPYDALSLFSGRVRGTRETREYDISLCETEKQWENHEESKKEKKEK